MNLYDILGPVMVGPSSSHTAGAVRIGLITRRLLGKAPAKADIALAGSFAATGRGHGTDRALAAGLLGMQPDDTRIPDSLQLASNVRKERLCELTILGGLPQKLYLPLVPGPFLAGGIVKCLHPVITNLS